MQTLLTQFPGDVLRQIATYGSLSDILTACQAETKMMNQVCLNPSFLRDIARRFLTTQESNIIPANVLSDLVIIEEGDVNAVKLAASKGYEIALRKTIEDDIEKLKSEEETRPEYDELEEAGSSIEEHVMELLIIALDYAIQNNHLELLSLINSYIPDTDFFHQDDYIIYVPGSPDGRERYQSHLLYELIESAVRHNHPVTIRYVAANYGNWEMTGFGALGEAFYAKNIDIISELIPVLRHPFTLDNFLTLERYTIDIISFAKLVTLLRQHNNTDRYIELASRASKHIPDYNINTTITSNFQYHPALLTHKLDELRKELAKASHAVTIADGTSLIAQISAKLSDTLQREFTHLLVITEGTQITPDIIVLIGLSGIANIVTSTYRVILFPGDIVATNLVVAVEMITDDTRVIALYP